MIKSNSSYCIQCCLLLSFGDANFLTLYKSDHIALFPWYFTLYFLCVCLSSLSLLYELSYPDCLSRAGPFSGLVFNIFRFLLNKKIAGRRTRSVPTRRLLRHFESDVIVEVVTNPENRQILRRRSRILRHLVGRQVATFSEISFVRF